MIRKFIAKGMQDFSCLPGGEMHIWAEEIGDQYHTIHELYQHRMALNIVLFNILAYDVTGNFEVMKSKLHNDGTMFDGYFIVMMIIKNVGQVSYHYDMKHWNKFKIAEVERTLECDVHGSLEVIERLMQI